MIRTLCHIDAPGRVGVILMLISLGACASGENRDTSQRLTDAVDRVEGFDGRLMVVEVTALDSAEAAAPVVVDRMLRQAFDSIAAIDYVSMEQAATVTEGDSAVSTAELGRALRLDGVAAVKVARFSSVVGVDVSLFEPETGNRIFHDRTFEFIRYRAEDGTKLFGPALYAALERAVHRLARRPDTERFIVSAEPLIVSNVVIDRDTTLGKIAESREKISTDGVRALGDFMRLKYPELIVFDYESRARVYETVGVTLVEDHARVGDLERQAMYSLDLPYYLTTGIYPVAGDSVEVRAAVHRVQSPRTDTVLFSAQRRFRRVGLETSTMVEDVITRVLEVASDALDEYTEYLRHAYDRRVAGGNRQGPNEDE